MPGTGTDVQTGRIVPVILRGAQATIFGRFRRMCNPNSSCHQPGRKACFGRRWRVCGTVRTSLPRSSLEVRVILDPCPRNTARAIVNGSGSGVGASWRRSPASCDAHR